MTHGYFPREGGLARLYDVVLYGVAAATRFSCCRQKMQAQAGGPSRAFGKEPSFEVPAATLLGNN